MDKTRGKFSKLIVLSILTFGLAINFTPFIALADNPNIVTSMSSLTGGWNANYIGTNGKHWTLYGQKNVGKLLYATIHISGKTQETATGSTTSAKVTSVHNVGPYVSHKHNGSHHN